MPDREADKSLGFVADTVRRSLPNPKRPRLKTESEARLADIEAKSAQTYAQLETATAELKQLAELMADDGNAIPIETWEGDNSLVYHIEQLPTSKPG